MLRNESSIFEYHAWCPDKGDYFVFVIQMAKICLQWEQQVTSFIRVGHEKGATAAHITRAVSSLVGSIDLDYRSQY